MPEIVTCPNCTRKLRVPENLVGKAVKCPECKEAFLAQTEAGSESGDEANETPQRKSGRDAGRVHRAAVRTATARRCPICASGTTRTRIIHGGRRIRSTMMSKIGAAAAD